MNRRQFPYRRAPRDNARVRPHLNRDPPSVERAIELEGLTRARARETFSVVDASAVALELMAAPTEETKRFGKALGRAARRLRWRRLQQMYCSKISCALAAGERALGAAYAGRERQPDKSWHMRAKAEDGSQTVAIMVAPTPISRFESFEEQIRVRVLRPALVDLHVLETALNGTNETWGRRA